LIVLVVMTKKLLFDKLVPLYLWLVAINKSTVGFKFTLNDGYCMFTFVGSWLQVFWRHSAAYRLLLLDFWVQVRYKWRLWSQKLRLGWAVDIIFSTFISTCLLFL